MERVAGTSRAVSGERWFQAASAGKHVTSWAVGGLAEEGRIDLSAPIESYLPDVPNAWGSRSVRSLATHTSGLPEYLLYQEGEAVPETRSGFFQTYRDLPVVVGEGASWNYVNTNYILLGFLIAEVTGSPFADHVGERLRGEGLAGIRVASPDTVRARNATGKWASSTGSVDAVIGDGDIAFTPLGAAAWLEYLLALHGRDGVMRDLLFAPPAFRSGRPSFYAGGLFVEPFGDDAVIHHAGHYDGWTAMLYLNAGLGAGAFVLTDQAPRHTRNVRAATQHLLEALCPGSTALHQHPVGRVNPELDGIVRRGLIWEAPPSDGSLFAEEMRPTFDGIGVRDLFSLAPGRELRDMVCIWERRSPSVILRRYRLRWSTGVEHLLTGFTPDGRLFWGWPC
ncbi:MAG: serine hydrolase domain-containing protein [Pseudomonadota bacterium]